MIYLTVPLLAALSITAAEVTAFETKLIREQFGLQGDVKNAEIQKVMDLSTTSTARVLSKTGSALRHKVQENRRAKPVKKIVITHETSEDEMIAEQERVSR